MRVAALLTVLLGTTACGDGVVATTRGPEVAVTAAPGLAGRVQDSPPEVPTPSALVAAPPAAAVPGPFGSLHGSDRLARAFEALRHLEQGRTDADVRILQYGDSHTASDLGVGVFRRVLQARFGDGGRGFVSLGKPWKTYAQDGVRGGMDAAFEPAKVKYRGGAFAGEGGCYGLLGVGVQASKADAHAWTSTSAAGARIEVSFRREPTGGSFDVFVDGARTGHASTRGPATTAGWLPLETSDAGHRIEVRTVGDGEVVLYGMTVDRPQAGVVVDALGIDGAQIFTPLRWGEACFAEQLRHATPDLVILAYGTNEALETGLTDAAYERALVDMLGRIARATPSASCLLLGPPDLARRERGQDAWKPLPRLDEIIAAQRRVTEAAGCAFYDQRDAMGGAGAMAVWASEREPRAGRDRIHLTRTGYAELGIRFATDLTRAYDAWRSTRSSPPDGAKPTWGGGPER